MKKKMSTIKVQNLVKTFTNIKAVNDISFEVQGGTIFGLLGPNGAGKTTTIRMMNNIIIPDSGQIFIDGEEVSSNKQNNIGYLPEERGLYKKMKVIDQILYFAELKGLTKAEANKNADYWLERFNALSWKNKKVQELSKGMQQKLQFITTILHDPDVLILDEPFSGFDPVNAELLNSVILELKSQGKAIILSTHLMHQVETMCDDICLINRGKAILTGSVRNIKRSFGKNTIIMEFEGNVDFLNEMENVRIIQSTSNRVELMLLDKTLKANDILDRAMNSAEIFKFELCEPSMNEIFIDQTKEDDQ
jgi:ABC-2 type transport system ATP-binding protein